MSAVKIVAVDVPARDRLNFTALDVCPNCGYQGYLPSDTLRLVDVETGEPVCAWGCANRARFINLEESWSVLRAHTSSGVASRLEELLRRQKWDDEAPERARRREEWREELKARSEEAQRRQAELDKLPLEERARKARELAW